MPERSREIEARLDRLEADVAEIKATVNAIQATQASTQTTNMEIKAILNRLDALIVRTLEGQAELWGGVADMPNARDFGRLEGQVQQIGAQMPSPIGVWQPPGGKPAG